ncbi:MAG: rod shape-determining protein MreC [Tannerella sp.]|jgi:rod shape-determining protein MreC|nr:rod shape-determining protein MreC [Tannerella sp.]
MQRLLEFLFKKRHWFVFIVCEVISAMFIYQYNAYHRNVIFSSANTVTGYASSIYNYGASYIKLRDDNQILFERNSMLEMELFDLRQQIQTLKANMLSFDSIMVATDAAEYSYITAQVVNNSISGYLNYITINKGLKDGVAADMGAVSIYGIVGIVSTVGDHFSVIIPILNPKSRISCKLYRGDYYGTLSWDGRDVRYANLEELPLHAEFQEGDTVVTSGYSTVFPPGVVVGTVVGMDDSRSHNFYSLKVKLATDFRKLKAVRILKSAYWQERLAIEQKAREND